MKTLSSDQVLTRDAGVIKGSTSNESLRSLDISTIALTKGIGRHVIYGKMSTRMAMKFKSI
jgi:hypothetical protein